MTEDFSTAKWLDIGWDGIYFQLPPSWQPTVIYPTYLFFEHEARPVLEIKWQTIQGRFSLEKTFDQIQETLKNETRLESWDIPKNLQHLLASYTVSGFQLQHEGNLSHGLAIYCPVCKRATLVQWYIDIAREEKLLEHIFSSFRDHSDAPEHIWSVYDIRALLPVEATLNSHEFLPGRYSLGFTLGVANITLYRFKPAAILLSEKNIGEFGTPLINQPPVEEGNGWAAWFHKSEGLDLLLAKARRKPVWQWMRLWHDPEHNVILGVKAEGKRLTGTGWLKKICENYISLKSQ